MAYKKCRDLPGFNQDHAILTFIIIIFPWNKFYTVLVMKKYIFFSSISQNYTYLRYVYNSMFLKLIGWMLNFLTIHQENPYHHYGCLWTWCFISRKRIINIKLTCNFFNSLFSNSYLFYIIHLSFKNHNILRSEFFYIN